MKYLVTGGAGFIGSHITEELTSQGHEVTIIDSFDDTLRPPGSRRFWLDSVRKVSNLKLIEADLIDVDLHSLVGDFDFLIHQAATPGLVPSWVSFEKYLQNNVLATQKLASAVASVSRSNESRLKRVVHASTSSVYGGIANSDESQPTTPISPYGITKLASEQIWAAYTQTTEIELVILRYFSVYGPRQREDMAWSKFIRAISQGEKIEITGDGEQRRSATYVRDVAKATLAATTAPVASGIYNICGDEGISVNNALLLIEQILGKSADKRHTEKRLGDQLHTQGINDKAKRDLGFQNETTIKEGLEAQIKDYLLRQTGVAQGLS
jgi:nucleoside-diphosphate-sugar epimerase